MKKTIFTIANLLFCVLVFGQSVPQGINYQAVARDANGNEITNQSLTVRLSVISGTASGTLSWQETHSLTTNDFGLFTAVIGQGISTSAGSSSTFDLVDWSSSSHYVKVEIDFGSGYLDLGTNELLSVPYALAAGSATNQHWNKLHNVGWNNDTVLHYDGKIAIGVNHSNVNGYVDFQVGEWSDKADVEINADDFTLYSDDFDLNSDKIRLNDMDGLRLINYSGYTMFQARDGDLRLNDYSGDAILNVNEYDGFEVHDASGYSWNSTPIFKVDISNSNVGIGTDNPNSSYTLDVVGDAQFSGNIHPGSVILSSDRRFKREIKTVDNALNKVLQLRGVNYYWKKKDFPNKNFDDKLELGLIAQEVEKIIPEIVEQTEDGYKAVEYQKLVALLVEAIKEQQAIIDGQKTEMTDMRAELDGRLKALEELLNTTTSNK